MAKNIFVLCALVVCSVYVSTVSGILPFYIRACSRSNKLNECALRVAKVVSPTFAKGDPTLGIPSLEPLMVNEINTYGSKGFDGIKLVLRDNVMTGVGGLEVKTINIDEDKQRVTVGLFGDLKLDSEYELTGRLLIISLSEKGKVLTGLHNVRLEYFFDYVLVTKDDGKQYFNITNDNVKYHIGKASFKLDNLFDGDELLGETVNNLLNEMWKDILTDVALPVVLVLKTGFTSSVAAFLKHVSYDEFFTP